MGISLLPSVIMSRSCFLLFFLTITVYTWQSVEGRSNDEASEMIENTLNEIANPVDKDILRYNRSAQKSKKQGKKNGRKIKKRKNKGKKNNKGKKKNEGRKKSKGSKKKKQLRTAKKSKKTKQLRKARKSKRKNKKTKQRKGKTIQRGTKQSSVSCPSTAVNTNCLENAMMSLAYEKNQVTNYIKQAKRLDNHQNISSNKLTKKNEFESAAKHMLWAIGGNLSDPKCGQDTNDTKRAARQQRGLKDSIANYQKLYNCSNSIKEACDITLKNDTYDKDDHAEEIEKCRLLKSDFINVSKECVSAKDQANATLQCECWAKAAKDVADIKKLKCETKKKQKLVTEHKNQCIKAFGKCKKMEDEAIELIHICMHDHSNEFINQTAAGLNQAAEEAGREELKRRLIKLGF